MPVLNQQIIKVKIEGVGEFAFQRVTVGDSSKIFELVSKKEISNSEFVKSVLFNQLVKPEITKEEFQKTTDENIGLLAKEFIKVEPHYFKNYKDTKHILLDFRESITLGVNEDAKRLKELIEPMVANSKHTIALFESLAGNSQRLVDVMVGASSMSKTMQKILVDSQSIFKSLDTTKQLINAFSMPVLPDFSNTIAKQILDVTKGWDNLGIINTQVKANYLSSLASINMLSKKESILALTQSGEQIVKLNQIFRDSLTVIPSYPKPLRDKISEKIYGSVDEINNYIIKSKAILERNYIYEPWETFGKVLKNQPERICEVGLSLALESAILNQTYKLYRQAIVGNGRTDIIIDFWDGFKLETVVIEIKVFRDNDSENLGINQTIAYLKLLQATYGFRVIFNSTKKELKENVTRLDGKIVTDIIVNINPTKPSIL